MRPRAAARRLDVALVELLSNGVMARCTGTHDLSMIGRTVHWQQTDAHWRWRRPCRAWQPQRCQDCPT
jgi:hypothetical protein